MGKKRFVLLAIVPLLIGCIGDENGVSSKINSEPEIQAFTATPDSVIYGESCVVRCSAVDPDNDQLSYEWEATAGSISGSGSEVIYTPADCCEGPIIKVTVKDKKGGEVKKEMMINLIYVEEQTVP